MKFQAPTSNIQRSTKFQASNKSATDYFWMLEFEVSLELGAWNLELS